MNHLLNKSNVTELVHQMRTHPKRTGCMIILTEWNVQSTLRNNVYQTCRIKLALWFFKGLLLQRYQENCCPTVIKQLLWTLNSCSSMQFKCFTAIQDFHWASQLSRSHKLLSESNEECLVNRNSSLAFQIHSEGKSKVTMQGRLCYVTMLNYCMVTAWWPSLNDYLPPCTSTHIQETNGLSSCPCLSHVSACLFAFSLSHSLNSRKMQLEAKSYFAGSPPTTISHTQDLLAAMVFIECRYLFATDDGMSLTWRRWQWVECW